MQSVIRVIKEEESWTQIDLLQEMGYNVTIVEEEDGRQVAYKADSRRDGRGAVYSQKYDKDEAIPTPFPDHEIIKQPKAWLGRQGWLGRVLRMAM